MPAWAATNTLHCAPPRFSAFFINFWKIQAQMWWEQDQNHRQAFTHTQHNVRRAYCYFVQAVKVCPGQRESPQKQQLKLLQRGDICDIWRARAIDLLLVRHARRRIALFQSDPLWKRSAAFWSEDCQTVTTCASCTRFKDLVAAANQWWSFSCAVCQV